MLKFGGESHHPSGTDDACWIFWESLLLPSLFSMPGGLLVFVSHCLMFPLHAVTSLHLKEETPLHVWRQ